MNKIIQKFILTGYESAVRSKLAVSQGVTWKYQAEPVSTKIGSQ
jgi:hypothetical protein